MLDVEPTLAAIQRHLDRGYRKSEIITAAGISLCAFVKLMNGTSRKVTRATAEKIAAIPELPTHAGTMRRVTALNLMGWSDSEISRRAFFRRTAIAYARHENRFSMDLRRGIATIYDELRDTPGPSVQAANAAQCAGGHWAWEWTDIDDENEIPRGAVMDSEHLDREVLIEAMLSMRYKWPKFLTPQQEQARIEAIRRRLQRGDNRQAIAVLLNTTERTVTRVCAKHGLRAADLAREAEHAIGA